MKVTSNSARMPIALHQQWRRKRGKKPLALKFSTTLEEEKTICSSASWCRRGAVKKGEKGEKRINSITAESANEEGDQNFRFRLDFAADFRQGKKKKHDAHLRCSRTF